MIGVYLIMWGIGLLPEWVSMCQYVVEKSGVAFWMSGLVSCMSHTLGRRACILGVWLCIAGLYCVLRINLNVQSVCVVDLYFWCMLSAICTMGVWTSCLAAWTGTTVVRTCIMHLGWICWMSS
jgi:hypothetical protein